MPCGERGIRTPEGFDTLLAFQASALDHYAISPHDIPQYNSYFEYYTNVAISRTQLYPPLAELCDASAQRCSDQLVL